MVIKGIVCVIFLLTISHGDDQVNETIGERLQDSHYELNIEYMYEPITIGKLTGLTTKECKQCYCGIANHNTRIVGGWTTRVHEYPWIAALLREGRFFCGGTLINDRYIMTAAHCVKKRNKNLSRWDVYEHLTVIIMKSGIVIPRRPSLSLSSGALVSQFEINVRCAFLEHVPMDMTNNAIVNGLYKLQHISTQTVASYSEIRRYYNKRSYLTFMANQYMFDPSALHARFFSLTKKDWVKREVKVVLSEHNRKNPDDTVTEVRRVSRTIVHPDFGPRTLDSDIALLRLDRAVEYRHGIRPACLPPRQRSFIGEWAIIAGWGTTSEQGSTSETLREAFVQILSKGQCSRKGYGYENWQITENMMCAGGRGADSCQGDSGGPLMLRNRYSQMYSAGIVSWGEGCARPYKPGIYTKVNNFLDWILENTKDACYCY